MFKKPIDRDIKGVIKVGQHEESNIYQELNEYVVTRELKKHFREFFENYKKGINGYTDEMGVWISGFFGSGKSHFLKILSYILNNEEVNGRKAIDFFRQDKKIDDPLVIADMDLAANISTDVILFNIDSKSENSQGDKDLILSVFLKMFNEMQGYCGEISYLAELERKLDEEGLFEDFKREFKEINGEEWLKVRETFFFIQDDVVETLSKLGYMSEEAARNWAKEAEKNYPISIDKFAEMVKDYCASKGKNHHVVFLVDEIGQYIGDNSKLMLNLQTITEDLGVKCGGKAWIIVTSQEDIDSIMKVKGNDFSKIQARFKTRLSLSSANVDEVIRKRILAKNDTAKQTLESLYDEKEAILKNLINFTSDTAEKKMYVNSEDFAAVYPFIPYQFNLLGNVLKSIRIHGASGKHLSEGERSMLALFQESAISLMDKELGVLMPFNIFYNALHKFVDHTHSSVIIKAMNNQNLDKFDAEVLKVLFMIKYVDEIKAKLENITTLMVSHIDEDVVDLRKKIEKSLKRLEAETLVQKNGEIYSFLTDEEQDINRAINNENVEMGEIINEASNVIFEEIFTDKKYKCSPRYNFPFNQAVDDRYRGNKQSADIGVRVITPYYELGFSNDNSQTTLSPQSESEKATTILRGMSSEKNEVIVYLENEIGFLEEIEGLLKIKKYLTKQSAELSPSSRGILIAKQEEASEKRQRIRIFLEEALKHGDIYVKGDKVDIKDKNPVDRISEALGKLVDKIYHKLSYMETGPDEADILNALNDVHQESFGNSNNKNQLAIDEMTQYIDYKTQNHAKPSLKTILTTFKGAPYGFVDRDIEWLIATLFAQKSIYLVKNGEAISLKKYSSNQILKFLTQTQFQEKVLIDKKEKTDDRKIKDVKEVLKEFFGIVNSSDDDETLMDKLQEQAQEKFNKIDRLQMEYSLENRYPGKNVISESLELLRDVKDIRSMQEFFNKVSSCRDDFLDLQDDLDSVLNFFNGPQKEIFKKACKVEDLYSNNKNYVDDPDLAKTAEGIEEIINMPNPFSNIHRLPELSDRFNTQYESILENEKKPVKGYLEDDLEHVLGKLGSDKLKDKFESGFKGEFSELEDKLASSKNISTIRGIQDESCNLMNKCTKKIKEFKPPTVEPANPSQGPTNQVTEKTLDLKNISKNRITIEKEEDIDEFLELLREKLKEELKENTIINLRI